MAGPEKVTDAIRAFISDRSLGPGDRLPAERVLAQQLGISRPALREGISRLVDAGLLRARQGAGTYVADVDPQELLAVRLRLEPLAAELAASRAGARDRAALRRLVAVMEDAVGDPSRFAELDLELHARIARIAGNRVLVRVLADLDQLLRVSRAQTAAREHTRRRALADVARLVDAIAAGDADAAAAAMADHLLAVGRADG